MPFPNRDKRITSAVRMLCCITEFVTRAAAVFVEPSFGASM